MPTFTDPQTESSMSAIKYFDSSVENTLVFSRRGRNEEVNMGISHFNEHHELTVTMFEMEGDEPVEIAEQIHLTFDEAKLLRALLNRPDVLAILDRGGK
jgi:hypothetical protein